MLFVLVDPPHPCVYPEDALMKRCEITFGRTSGPGGQHRNKVETAVNIRHVETGVEAHAYEKRKQFENRRTAVRRLRERLAIEVRCRTHRNRHEPSDLWQRRRQGKQLSINARHWDYPALLAEAMDVIHARDGDVAGAAGVLGVSMSQLARLVGHHKRAFVVVNEEREARGLPPLKPRR